MLECTEIKHCLTSLPQLLLDGHLTLYRDERLYVFVIGSVLAGVQVFFNYTWNLVSFAHKHLAFVLKATFYSNPNYEWRLPLQLDSLIWL